LLNLSFVVNAGAFEDPEIIHVDDSVDPVRDLETITAELRLKVYYAINF
jgi:ribosome-binding ATPase YchF (GTP1/OBG family)